MSTKFISVIIPAYNEEKVIDIPIKRVFAAFKEYGLTGEIIIMDSSTDNTTKIAESLGARAIKIPKQGLGKAYIESLKHINGDYIVMGDADGTYDFMEMNNFISLLDKGYDFVMGSRLKGNIHKGAMPWSHRYLGTPFLTFFINLFFKAGISDCNSGLRALTKNAFQKIKLQSWGWEYASEMVIKAKLCNLKLTEIPISLLPDSRDRKPHLNPWLAGWTNLKFIFLLASEFIFLKLGAVITLLGFIIMASQIFGDIHIFGLMFGSYYLFLGLILSTTGLSIIQMGLITQNFSFLSEYRVTKISKLVKKHFNFEKGIVLSLVSFSIGFLFLLYVFLIWLNSGIITYFEMKMGIYSLFFIITGIQSLYFSFIFYLFNTSSQKGLS
jgi:glycosyltransferase involved in cell wall biosynthesis